MIKMVLIRLKALKSKKEKNTYSILVTYIEDLNFINYIFKNKVFKKLRYYFVFPKMYTNKKGDVNLISLNEFCNLLPKLEVEDLNKYVIILVDLYLYDLKQELLRRNIDITGGKTNQRHIVNDSNLIFCLILIIFNYRKRRLDINNSNHKKLQLTEPKYREKDWISTELVIRRIKVI